MCERQHRIMFHLQPFGHKRGLVLSKESEIGEEIDSGEDMKGAVGTAAISFLSRMDMAFL